MKFNKEEMQSLLKSQVEKQKTTVTFDEVWSNYMDKNRKNRTFKLPKVGLVACALLLAVMTPVGASIYVKWHNLEVVAMDEEMLAAVEADEEAIPWMAFEHYPDYLATYEQISLEESNKIAGFEILRPINFNMPLEISAGVLNGDGSFYSYWDLFHQGNEWIYVKQELLTISEELLQEENLKHEWKIKPDADVVVFEDQDAIAVISDEKEHGYWINMLVKNNQNQVIGFEIRGNLSKERMMELVEAYLLQI